MKGQQLPINQLKGNPPTEDCSVSNVHRCKYDLYSRGIEDIRLYEHDGLLKFIATTVEYHNTNGNRTIIGDYNYETNNYSNSQIIYPSTNTWCEKNWIPVPDPEGLGREMVYIQSGRHSESVKYLENLIKIIS